ncbi:LysR family transcriptional regulator [Sinomonas atrocyanea]|uniref:LysR family transcriptional regulator n=1 Tax=Sinomonas atrocyanea TaxID=37927 RepID=UPI003D98729A
MEIRWLEAFVAVAEELHFGRAASRLHMAQSPLSQTIRKLEKDIGVPLFDRSTRSVSLTASGRSLLPHAYRALEELEVARQAAHASVGTVYGHLTVSFTGAINHRTLPRLTRALRRQYPDVVLSLQGRVVTGDAVAQLQQGTLDLAFVGLPLDPSPLASRLIAREALGAVVPVDHPLAQRATLDLGELRDEDFIMMPSGGGSDLERTATAACVAAGFRPRVVQTIGDPFMILTFVAAGMGVSLVSEGMSDILPHGAVYVPLSGAAQPYLRHGLAWAPSNPSRVLPHALAVAKRVLPTVE